MPFHSEKELILQTGLEFSSYLQADDTGARHNGNNGYCTCICNEFFAIFSSGDTKTRRNFLKILQGRQGPFYKLTEEALAYMLTQKVSKRYYKKLNNFKDLEFKSQQDWEAFLKKEIGIVKAYAFQIPTEGALLGGLISRGFDPEMGLVSDDAGQFNLFKHGLCWVHAERHIAKVNCYNRGQRQLLEGKKELFWQLYKDLKAYKDNPESAQIQKLSSQFDELLKPVKNFVKLNHVMKKLATNKKELLLVLYRPEIPLHNNTCERDIREFVRRRKVSGPTRSDSGRKCRDTFISLKKTCHKLKVSFWQYINDRVSKTGEISPLNELLYLKMTKFQDSS